MSRLSTLVPAVGFAPDMVVGGGTAGARALDASASVLGAITSYLVELARWADVEGSRAQVLVAPVEASWGSWLDVVVFDRAAVAWAAAPGRHVGRSEHRFISAGSLGHERDGINVSVARFELRAADVPPLTDVAGCVLAYPGLHTSGDELDLQCIGNSVRVSVIDALGHGEVAARSAASLSAFLRARPHLDVATVLVEAHHARAADPRGAAAALLDLPDDGAGSFAGVGNIDAVAFGGAARPIARAGTIGVALRTVAHESAYVPPGGALVLASDGFVLRWPAFVLDALAALSAPMLLGAVLALAERKTDDATLAVVRRPP